MFFKTHALKLVTLALPVLYIKLSIKQARDELRLAYSEYYSLNVYFMKSGIGRLCSNHFPSFFTRREIEQVSEYLGEHV